METLLEKLSELITNPALANLAILGFLMTKAVRFFQPYLSKKLNNLADIEDQHNIQRQINLANWPFEIEKEVLKADLAGRIEEHKELIRIRIEIKRDFYSKIRELKLLMREMYNALDNPESGKEKVQACYLATHNLANFMWSNKHAIRDIDKILLEEFEEKINLHWQAYHRTVGESVGLELCNERNKAAEKLLDYCDSVLEKIFDVKNSHMQTAK